MNHICSCTQFKKYNAPYLIAYLEEKNQKVCFWQKGEKCNEIAKGIFQKPQKLLASCAWFMPQWLITVILGSLSWWCSGEQFL